MFTLYKFSFLLPHLMIYLYHVFFFHFSWFHILYPTFLIDCSYFCAVAMPNMFKELLSRELDDRSLLQSDYFFGRFVSHFMPYARICYMS